MTAASQNDDFANDAAIDRFYSGYDAHMRGEACPSEKDAAAGWRDRARECRVRVVMPRRPEGYYHAPVGSFD